MPATADDSAQWMRVGNVSPASLTDAGLQFHHAAQIVVSAAISYIPARPDDSHTAMSWIRPVRGLVSEPITAERPLWIGLRPVDLTLLALDSAMLPVRTFALAGRPASEAHAWLGDVGRMAGLDPALLTSRKHYTIPAHAVASGSPFSIGSEETQRELERYWSNAVLVLDELARSTTSASPVRCWPHHFDIATIIALPGTSRARRPTIGVGHSSGDAWYAEPYWYVGPYPYPATSDLPAIGAGGHWHTTGWVGAALPASRYAMGEGRAQREQVTEFIGSAIAACRRLLAV